MSLIKDALAKAGRLPDKRTVSPPVATGTGERPVTLPLPKIPLPSRDELKEERKNLVALEKNIRKLNLPRKQVLTAAAILFASVVVPFLIFRLVINPWFFQKPQNSFFRSAAGVNPTSIVPTLASAQEYKLTGITSYGDSRFALINEKVVAVGDRLEGNAVVKEIYLHAVVLEIHGREIKLTL